MNDCSVGAHPSSCYNLFFAAPFFPQSMIKAPQFYTIPKMKTPDAYRISVLGESAAMGDPDPAHGFSHYLEVMLRERFPDTKFEVINTGIVAIDWHVILPIARELAHYKPDLFIIYPALKKLSLRKHAVGACEQICVSVIPNAFCGVGNLSSPGKKLE